MSGKLKRMIALSLAAAVILAVGFVMATADNEAEEEPFVIVYTNVADLVVYVDGNLSADLTQNSVLCGEPITLDAPAVSGKTFSHWAIDSADGTVVSYQNPYTIAVNADTTLYAVYGGTAEDKPVVAFTTKARQDYLGDDSIRLTATYSLPEGQSASNVGIRYSYNELFGVADEAADLTDSTKAPEGVDVLELLKSDGSDMRVRETSGAASGDAGDWTLSLTSPGEDAIVYAVAFVETGGETVYSELAKVQYKDLELGVVADSNMDLPFNLPGSDGG